MEELKSIISGNIVALRKKNKLTQIELSKQINYSDKAISRWETGEVVPDVETLNSLAKVFDVPVTYFFEYHKDIDVQLSKPSKNQALSHFSTLSIIWTVLAIVFVYFKEFRNESIWQIFVWGIPLCCAALLFLYKKWELLVPKFIIKTILCWSFLTALYLSLLHMNLWMVYIIGIPIQFTIITSSLKNKH